MKQVIAIICAAITLTACGGDNLFEKAFNPFTGTTKLVNEWKDKGGLDGENKFHGLNITEMQYRFEQNGAFASMQATVSADASPEKMRKALSKVCKIDNSAFKIVNTTDAMGVSLTGGTAKSAQVYCAYDRKRQKNTILIQR